MVSEQQTIASAFSNPNSDAPQLIINRSSKPMSMKLALTVKLDNSNFLLWRQQVQAAVKGNRLFSFLDPEVSPPPKLSSNGSISEEYLDWEQQDQALLVWILSSITQELLPEFVSCSTACEAWQTIQQLFSSQLTANIMQLKLQLQTLKKGGLTMSEYLMKKKSIIDNLAFTGYVMSKEDKLMSILGGLGSEYYSFIIPITSMPHNYSIADITALLLTHEARMEQDT
ncbi:hypothetical protein ACOSP7_006218 [Xanthoceras sorbifolium]